MLLSFRKVALGEGSSTNLLVKRARSSLLIVVFPFFGASAKKELNSKDWLCKKVLVKIKKAVTTNRIAFLFIYELQIKVPNVN